ncbi:ABC transporter ATP-binding protein [Chamaesiphon sp. VAR_69_metabat_338]|uniref:ABC transporter ATP-binding protein n=1 Tax=Chamaesiphon sp. VAR_69_metabat_338 TaxID=2964704 RepID=UPI00286E329D|nr:ABC transporter ATP-binding protein [Chamaesiphon sp. VAR_69_metabat_338]
MPQTLLDVRNLWVSYPQSSSRQQAVKAIDKADTYAIEDVSFQLAAGEKIGFVGESGCGKSTLGKAIMRLLPPQSRIEGQILFEGQSVPDLNPEAIQRFRGETVGLIFQDPMTRLDPLMTIGNHCLETLQAHEPRLTKQQAKQRALDTLAAVKITADRWHQYPHEFSGGMRQRVAIALALLLNPKLIIADEPTTSLDVRVSAEILQELTRLCAERQMGLLLISHDLATIATYCDRIVVMNKGRKEEEGTVEQIFGNPQALYTQTLLRAALHIQADREQPAKVDDPDVENSSVLTKQQVPILTVDRLQKYYTIETSFLQRLFTKAQTKIVKAVDNIQLELYEGEIFGLVGESGCGKSTLSRTILQLIPATGGTVTFAGEELTRLSPAEMRAKRRDMQMIFQDPSASLNPMMTVGESIADPLNIHQLNATPAATRAQVLAMLERVGLNPAPEYFDRYPRQLSGGQQQRVGIARALITKPKLVICDEPVSMLDATIQSEVLDLMLELKRQDNLTYLFITHDLWLARFLCDRIAVMNRGQIVEMGPTQAIFSNPQHPYTQELLAAAPLLRKQG